MITIQTNMGAVIADEVAKVEHLITETKNDILRGVSIALLPVVRDRIHVNGQDASGGQIGTYSPGYMKVRTGQFSTNASFSKGKNKGQTKPTGVFTRGKNKGAPRPNYNRSGDPKVILSLAKQMENDFSVIAEANVYGLGFKNPLNFEKARWCEETYGKKIYGLTEPEKELVVTTAIAQISNALRTGNS